MPIEMLASRELSLRMTAAALPIASTTFRLEAFQ